MTKEEEKAIEIVAKYLNFNEICGTRNFKEALETVLNMLKEKDTEIEKKDKIIDLMAEKIFKEGIVWEDKDDVKQYFEKLAERKK